MTITISAATDDELYIWLGPYAYSGWNKTNYFVNTNQNPQIVTLTYDITQGQYIPIRVQLGQVTGLYSWSFQITMPDGTLLMGTNAAPSPLLYQFSCDLVTAPPYPPWGQEGDCGNLGVEWAYYPSPYTDSHVYDADPAHFKAVTPSISGVTEDGVYWTADCEATTDTYNFYGTNEVCQDFALAYRGYIYANETGLYTVSVPMTSDDRAWVWMGSTAYSGWDGTNYNAVAVYDGTTSGAATYNVTQAGTYVPFRVLLAQAGGPWYLSITITAPDGTVLMSPDATAPISKNLVKYSCDGSIAAPFQHFGSET